MGRYIDHATNPSSVEQCHPTVTAELAARLEAALASIGQFGEVRLVVVKGRVRFIETVRSEGVSENAARPQVLE